MDKILGIRIYEPRIQSPLYELQICKKVRRQSKNFMKLCLIFKIKCEDTQKVNQFNAVLPKSSYSVLMKNRADILLVSYWIYLIKISAGDYDCENNGIFLRVNRIWNSPVYDCLMFTVLYLNLPVYDWLMFIILYFKFTCLWLFNVYCFIF